MGKTCKKCKIEKDFSEFWNHRLSKDRLDYFCRDCRSKLTEEEKKEKQEKLSLISKGYKKCSKCGQIKSFSDYHKAPYGLGGITSVCKDCNKIYRIQNKDKLALHQQEYNANNKEKTNSWARQYRATHIERAREIGRKCDKKRRAAKSAYLREKRKTDPSYKIATNLRRRMNRALKAQFATKQYHFDEYLGCTLGFLKQYLESLFKDGMTWDALLQGLIHIDHIIPCAAFDLTDPEQQKECFHYTNLQPLWAKDNMRKGAKILIENETYSTIS